MAKDSKNDPNNLEPYRAGVLKTGFPLEFQVGKAFQRHGWSAINSRYYVDDVKGVAREIDVIAYKVAVHDDVEICTAVIVSCKKSDEKAWALIAQNRNEKDPNIDWFPLHAWTNQKVLRYVLEDTKWESSYLAEAKAHAFFGNLIKPEHHIFAFQELLKSSGAPKNDTAIYDAVSSLMKAQGYEVQSREQKDSGAPRRILNFNLLSVVQSDLLLCKLTEDFLGNVETIIQKTSSEKYIGSYIINQDSMIARINFVRYDALEPLLTSFDEMHDFNIKFFEGQLEEYYQNPFATKAAVDVFEEQFASRIMLWVRAAMPKEEREFDASDLSIWLRRSGEELIIGVPVWKDDSVEDLNSNERLLERTRLALKEYYRYDGPFKFDADIPF